MEETSLIGYGAKVKAKYWTEEVSRRGVGETFVEGVGVQYTVVKGFQVRQPRRKVSS